MAQGLHREEGIHPKDGWAIKVWGESYASPGFQPAAFIQATCYDVVEMVLADEVRTRLATGPQRYAANTREYLGWGVFALMRR